VASGFYERGSNVIAIKDEKQFKKEVLNSEFLWVVEFYREGCGYCQLLTPEWEKVAANLKHLVKVAAVDTERNRQVASKHYDDANPIQGVPTIKLYIPSGKPGKPRVMTYQGERKAKAIVNFLTSYMPDHVIRLKKQDGSYDAWMDDKSTPKVVLVTDKSETSATFKALSAEYKGRVRIGKVVKKDTETFKLFGPENLPALLQLVEDRKGNLMALMAYDFSKGKTYSKLSNFIWDCEKEWKRERKKEREAQGKGGDL